jgi:outer membrane protein assembly factor BamB
MSETTIDREIDALNRFWNELVAPGTAEPAADERVSEEVEQLVRELHASAATIAGFTAPPRMRFASLPVGEPRVAEGPRAKAERRWLGQDRFGSGRRRVTTVLSVLATAAVLLAALTGVLLSGGLWRGDESTVSGVAPDATGPDIGQTGLVEDIPPASGVALDWQVTLPSQGVTRPAIADGLVVVGLADGTLVAMELADGTERWRRAVDRYAMGTPTIVDGMVLIAQSGQLLALNASNGETYWNVQHIASSGTPIVDEGRVYAVTTRAGIGKVGLMAAELATGRELWRNDDLPGMVSGQPAAGNGLVYANVGEVTVVALDGKTGEMLWQQPTSGRVDSPVVAGDTVYVAGYKGMLALDANTGVLRWRKLGEPDNAAPEPGDDLTTRLPAVADGAIYFVRGTDSLRALDAETGELTWVLAREGSNFSGTIQPIVTADAVIVDIDNLLRAFDLETGEPLWELPITTNLRRLVAVAEGRLIEVVDVDDSIRCYVLIPLETDS